MKMKLSNFTCVHYIFDLMDHGVAVSCTLLKEANIKHRENRLNLMWADLFNLKILKTRTNIV